MLNATHCHFTQRDYDLWNNGPRVSSAVWKKAGFKALVCFMATWWQRTFKFLILFTLTKAKFCRSRHFLRVNIFWKEKQTNTSTYKRLQEWNNRLCILSTCCYRNPKRFGSKFSYLNGSNGEKTGGLQICPFYRTKGRLLTSLCAKNTNEKTSYKKNVLWLFYATHRICISFCLFQRFNKKCH